LLPAGLLLPLDLAGHQSVIGQEWIDRDPIQYFESEDSAELGAEGRVSDLIVSDEQLVPRNVG